MLYRQPILRLPGRVVIITATVAPTTGTGTPTGTVTFTIDGKAGSPVGLTEINGKDQATFVDACLGGGQVHDHRVL